MTGGSREGTECLAGMEGGGRWMLAQRGARGTRKTGGAGMITVFSGDDGARSKGGGEGSRLCGIWDSVAGCRDRGTSH